MPARATTCVTALDLRTAVEELWLAGAEAVAINGERVTPTTAVIDIGSSVLVNSAYLAPPFRITALGPDDLYTTLSASPGFVDLVRARADAYGIRISFAEPESVDLPAFAGTVTLRYARPIPAVGSRPQRDARAAERCSDGATRSRSPAVTFLLGILVVVQLRAQTEGSPLAQLSSQDLTVLVANLNGRNDQLRREVATLERDLASAHRGRGARRDLDRRPARRARARPRLRRVCPPWAAAGSS